MNGKTIKCDMCGANLRFETGQAAMTCPYCGTQQWSAAHGASNAAEAPKQPEGAPRQGEAPETEKRQKTAAQNGQAQTRSGSWLIRLGKALLRLPPSAYKIAGTGAILLFIAWPNWFPMLLAIALFWHPWTPDKRYKRQQRIYEEACSRLRSAKKPEEFESAKIKFLEIPTFADSRRKIQECEEMILLLNDKKQRRRENAEEIKDLAREAAASILERVNDRLKNNHGH